MLRLMRVAGNLILSKRAQKDIEQIFDRGLMEFGLERIFINSLSRGCSSWIALLYWGNNMRYEIDVGIYEE